MSLADALKNAKPHKADDRRVFQYAGVVVTAPAMETPANVLYNSIRFDEIKMKDWPWRYFKPVEVMCKTTLMVPVHSLGFHKTMDMLDAMRKEDGAPMVLTNMYRSPKENKRVGGTTASQHMLGRAADIVLGGRSMESVEALARKHGARGIGRYPNNGFIHVDLRVGRRATWNR